MPPTPDKALHELLCELFAGDQAGLVQHVSLHFGPRFAAQLPSSGVALAQLAFAVQNAARRHGRLRELFASLKEERPAKVEAVAAVASLFGVTLPEVDESRTTYLGSAGQEEQGHTVVVDEGSDTVRENAPERPQIAAVVSDHAGDAPVDALIITALKSELDALLAVKDGLLSGWTKSKLVDHAHECVLAGADGPIRVLATRPTRMGGVSTASIASRLIEKINPRCLAMCGVCAGRPGDTAYGDVVIAERLFQHDEGKIKPEGRYGDLWVDPLRDDWLRTAQNLAGPAVGLAGYAPPEADRWKWWFLGELSAGRNPRESTAYPRYLPDDVRSARLRSLLKEGLIRRKGTTSSLTDDGKDALEEHLFLNDAAVTTLPFHILVGPMGSGSAVEAAGEIWDRLAKGGMRKTLAVEMEAAAIGRVAHEHDIPCVVAKGVMDHADTHKDDRFKSFAARASAEVLCRFLRSVRRLGPTRGRSSKDHGSSSRERPPDASPDEARKAEMYRLESFEDISNSVAKRCRGRIIVGEGRSEEEILEIVKSATESLRDSSQFVESTRALWGQRPAGAVWLYVFEDEGAESQNDWVCTSLWHERGLRFVGTSESPVEALGGLLAIDWRKHGRGEDSVEEGEPHDLAEELKPAHEETSDETATPSPGTQGLESDEVEGETSAVDEQILEVDPAARHTAPSQGGGNKLRFAVALSFPGEKRDFVSDVANDLAGKLSTSRVLYDRFHREEFARPDLGFHLPELYAKHSELVVVFVCDDYEQKRWCGAEWRQIHDLIFNGHDERVMLVRLDSRLATLRGLSESAGFYEVNTRTDSPESVARAILRRREQSRGGQGHRGRVPKAVHHGSGDGGASTATSGEDAPPVEEHAELEEELEERQRRLEKSLAGFFAPKARSPLRDELARQLEVSAGLVPQAIAFGPSADVLEALTSADEALLERKEGDPSDVPGLVEKALPVLLFRDFGHACKRQLASARRQRLSLQAGYPDSADGEIAGAEGADAELVATAYGAEGVHRLGRPPPGGFDLDGDLAADDTLAELLDRLDYEELSESDRTRLKNSVFHDLAGQPAFVGMLSARASKDADERRRSQLVAEVKTILERRTKKGKRSFYVLLDSERSDELWESIAVCVSQTFREVLTARLAGAGASEQYARIVAPLREIYSRRYKRQHEQTKRG